MKTAFVSNTGGIVPAVEAVVDRQETDPNCQALGQCVTARLRRLEATCTPEQWRLIVECHEYQVAHRRELARLCYMQGAHDAGPASRARARNRAGAVEVGPVYS